ncbi:FtsW/RodA/SpoVE family cell cycle protein, partial [Pseudomonadota bacterium]
GESGKSYQVEKSIEAMQSGGILGKGPVEGTMKDYIPDAHTDFIFAVIGEEFGLIILILLIFVFFFIGTRILIKNTKEKDLFSYLAVSGLALQFLVQATVNIGVTMSILPTKGMTLPFISYGGSSIISMAIVFGCILALTKRTYGNKISINSLVTE